LSVIQKIKEHKKNIAGLFVLSSVLFCVIFFDVKIGFTVFECIETIPLNILFLGVFVVVLIMFFAVIVIIIHVIAKGRNRAEKEVD